MSDDEDKDKPKYIEGVYNIKKEPSEVPNNLVHEVAAGLDNGYKIKIEEIDLKPVCFNNEMKDSFDTCSLKEYKRDYKNQNKSTESSSRQIEFVNVLTNEQTCFGVKDESDNDGEDDEHQAFINKEKSTIYTEPSRKEFIKSIKPHVCDVCNKVFTTPSNLLIHRRVHTGDKPYVCDVCNKRFTQICTLTEHKLIHTGVRPHVCHVCNKEFRRISDLARHKLIHTGAKPYVCDVCNKGFTQASILARHKLIHTDDKQHICDICNIRFRHLGALVIHKRTHTGDKPHGCDVCNKRFRHLNTLVVHRRSHTVCKNN